MDDGWLLVVGMDGYRQAYTHGPPGGRAGAGAGGNMILVFRPRPDIPIPTSVCTALLVCSTNLSPFPPTTTHHINPSTPPTETPVLPTVGPPTESWALLAQPGAAPPAEQKQVCVDVCVRGNVDGWGFVRMRRCVCVAFEGDPQKSVCVSML